MTCSDLCDPMLWSVLWLRNVQTVFVILPRKDYVYDEIQESFQKTDSGNAVTTVYATANFPAKQSDSLWYSTIKFQKSSDKADDEALALKPSSSACEYATVNYSLSPTYCTLSQSPSSKESLYSTVTKAQQQRGKISPVGKWWSDFNVVVFNTILLIL